MLVLQGEEMQQRLRYVCEQFRIPGEIVECRLIPAGHINSTYYVRCRCDGEEKEYLAQMVNWFVFRQPISMMNNIDLLTKHILKKENASERRRRIHFHHTAEGNNYLEIGDGEDMEFWRVSNYVEDSVSFETADGNPEVLYMSGRAFGRFGAQLCDFDAKLLVESIPHFHDTRWRMDRLQKDAEADTQGRLYLCRDEVEEILHNRDFACTLCDRIDSGLLPIRVTHNDTKTNNVLLDKATLEPLVVIDLDTCMPGLLAYDFGDTIRFAACAGAEDETDLSRMKVDFELFRAFARGYIGETAAFMTEAELESLSLGCAIMTLELASRFLADYLVGDQYFRISYPEHNLVRTRAQLALFRDMMEHLPEMDGIVRDIYKESLAQYTAPEQ